MFKIIIDCLIYVVIAVVYTFLTGPYTHPRSILSTAHSSWIFSAIFSLMSSSCGGNTTYDCMVAVEDRYNSKLFRYNIENESMMMKVQKSMFTLLISTGVGVKVTGVGGTKGPKSFCFPSP